MKHRKLHGLAIVAVMAALVGGCGGSGGSPSPDPFAGDEPLAVIEFDDPLGTAQIVLEANFGLGYSPDMFNYTAVLEEQSIGTSDGGTTRIAHPGNDAQFATVAARLANGVDEGMATVIGDGSSVLVSRTALESAWINGGLTGTLNPDAAGYTIGHIRMEIDSVTFDTPGSNPNADGVWTDIRVRGRFILMGQ